MKKQLSSIEAYIAASPVWAQPILFDMHKTIMKAVPEAEQKISYHVPYYSYYGRLAYIAVHTAHCSFHWVSDEDKKMYADALNNVHLKVTTIHVRPGEKVPKQLIRNIVKDRAARNKAKKK